MVINKLFTLAQNQDLVTLQSQVEEHTLQVEQKIIALKSQGDHINPQNPENGFTLLNFIAFGFLSNNLLKYFEASHIINISSRPLLHCATMVGNIEAMKWLLEKGQNIDIQNDDGHTALHTAVMWVQLEAITFLLANNANVNIQDQYGNIILSSVFDYGINDESKLKMIELLVPQDINFNLVNNFGTTIFDIASSHLYSQEEITKNKVLLLLLCNPNTNPLSLLNNIAIREFFTDQNNIGQLFAIEGYEKYKMAAEYNLYKALIEYGADNQNQIALNTAEYINQTFLNNAAHLLEEAFNIDKPHVIIPDIEQSNNIYLLRDNEQKCKDLTNLKIRLQESNINLAKDLGQHFLFHGLPELLSHIKKAEIATTKRITEIFVKDLKLPELPEEKLLIEELQTAINPQEKTLAIQKLQAPSMKEVFYNGDLMGLVCSFLDSQSASDFSYTNQNSLETIIQFSDQETLGTIDNQEHNEAS